jgi:hypothetical protein
MFSVHISAILVKGGLLVGGAIGIASIATAPAAANTARSMVNYSTPNYSASVSSELSSRYVVTGSKFAGQVNLTESGAVGTAKLNLTTTPDMTRSGYGGLQAQVMQTLSRLDVTNQQELNAYVGILKAAAGADGLEDSTGGYAGDEKEEVIVW